MPIYILLSRLSQQGVTTLKSNPDRLREVNRDVEELGAKVLHQWATLGEFDFINVVEAPDTATIARVSVALAARGSTKIETLPALTIDEFSRRSASSSTERSNRGHSPATEPSGLRHASMQRGRLARRRRSPHGGGSRRPGTLPRDGMLASSSGDCHAAHRHAPRLARREELVRVDLVQPAEEVRLGVVPVQP